MKDYTNWAPTQEEIDSLEKAFAAYNRSQNRLIDDAIKRFYKL